jgi:hypothetical protein
MSKDGAGDTHGIATWVSYKQIFGRQTDGDTYLLHGRQKLESAMAANPHLRTDAEKLVKDGVLNPWEILRRLGLANRQFTFRDGVSAAKRGQPANSKGTTR